MKAISPSQQNYHSNCIDDGTARKQVSSVNDNSTTDNIKYDDSNINKSGKAFC